MLIIILSNYKQCKVPLRECSTGSQMGTHVGNHSRQQSLLLLGNKKQLWCLAPGRESHDLDSKPHSNSWATSSVRKTTTWYELTLHLQGLQCTLNN